MYLCVKVLRNCEVETGRLGDEEKIKDKNLLCEIRSNFASKIISQDEKIKVKGVAENEEHDLWHEFYV